MAWFFFSRSLSNRPIRAGCRLYDSSRDLARVFLHEQISIPITCSSIIIARFCDPSTECVLSLQAEMELRGLNARSQARSSCNSRTPIGALTCMARMWRKRGTRVDRRVCRSSGRDMRFGFVLASFFECCFLDEGIPAANRPSSTCSADGNSNTWA